MHTDQTETTQGHQIAVTPAHLDSTLPKKVQQAHIRKRLGDIDLAIVELQNEKKELRDIHAGLK